MRITPRILLIGLLACGLACGWLRSTRAQSGVVNLRPRATATQPGTPEVKATVDRNRVAAGEQVVFTLSPAGILSDARYRVTLYFGDGQRQVARQVKILHVYKQSGTYTYSILVEAGKSGPAPTPLPAIPNVNLTVSPTSVETNGRVNFSAQLSRRYPNLKYRFVFGDGSQTGWQDDSQAAHSYRAANTYQAYVDIGVAANGSIRQSGGSRRESINVTEAVSQNVSVNLSANPKAVAASKPVTFTARANRTRNAKYRFDFGDKSVSGWQTSPRAKHQYKSAGKYSARVDVRTAERSNAKGAAANDSVTVEVAGEPSGKEKVDLQIIPANVPPGMPVALQAVPSSASTKAVYRFNFGDGSPPSDWSADVIQTHIYKVPGKFPAYVEMAGSGGEPVKAAAISDKKRVRIISLGAALNSNGNQNTNTPENANSSSTSRPNINANRNANASNNANSNSNSKLNGTVTGNINLAISSNANANGNGNAAFNAPTNANANSGSTNRNRNANGLNANSLAAVSPSASATPITVATSEATDWWQYIIIAAIILFAAYQVSSYFLAPRPTFVPHADPGNSKVAAGKPLSINLQTDVDPNFRNGEFKVDTKGSSLIKSKRTEP